MSQLDKNKNDGTNDFVQDTNKRKNSAHTKAGAFSVGFIEQIELIVIAFAAIVLLFSFAFRTCQVSGESMENTLFDGETVVVSKLFYTPKKNDIVVFHQTGTDQEDLNKPIVKRIIAVPGDYVTVTHSAVSMTVTVESANGDTDTTVIPIKEGSFIKYEGLSGATKDINKLLVKEGTVFVMGDNRSNSTDSRDPRIGLVDTRRILGKVIFRITPLSRMGTVK